ncbi:unnamed protein product [Danaus chrysippus]|uniref:(African queen) hypothetical protein n=1 Tax=Danaus chrysippus TaxID=151541 RepID=A0A8J2QFU7_9NEOP|nr:unnamed protein product [Danaus chrysippus]
MGSGHESKAHTHGLNALSGGKLHRVSHVLGSESVGERLTAGVERGPPLAPAAPRRPLPPMNDNNGRRSTRPQTE